MQLTVTETSTSTRGLVKTTIGPSLEGGLEEVGHLTNALPVLKLPVELSPNVNYKPRRTSQASR